MEYDKEKKGKEKKKLQKGKFEKGNTKIRERSRKPG